MPKITFNHRTYNLSKNKTLLESLLEQGEKIPYACRAGVCHSCQLKVDSGQAPAASQLSLPPQKICQGYFLACQCFPDGDMNISFPTRKITPAIITHLDQPSPTTLTTTLSLRFDLNLSTVEHIQLETPSGTIAHLPTDSIQHKNTQIQFHIERCPNDAFSQFMFDEARVGQVIKASL